jgi:hypothetical protein
MSESRNTVLRVAASICFVIGLIVFLSATRSAGEAPETFRLSVLAGSEPIIGAAIALLAATVLVVLLIWERRRIPKHP